MQLEHIAENLVRVTMRNVFTGRLNSMELPIREGQILFWKASGTPIQRVFPHLSADQREFLMTGVTPQDFVPHEWTVEFFGIQGEDA